MPWHILGDDRGDRGEGLRCARILGIEAAEGMCQLGQADGRVEDASGAEQVYDLLRQNPNAQAQLRAPIFEDKVVD